MLYFKESGIDKNHYLTGFRKNDDGKLVLKYADRKTMLADNIEENISHIIAYMEKQISPDVAKKLKTNYAIVLSSCILFTGVTSCLLFGGKFDSSPFYISAYCLGGGLSFTSLLYTFLTKRNLNEAIKYESFIEKKDEINGILKSVDKTQVDNLLASTSKEAHEVVKSVVEENGELNVNNISGLSRSDIETIITNNGIIDELALENNVVSETKPKVRKLVSQRYNGTYEGN